MAETRIRFAWAVVRELLLGVATWVGACATLALWYVLVPIDPVSAILGPNASPENAAQVRRQLGLNAPAYEQFLSTTIDLATFQFGESYVIYPQTPVWELVSERIAMTLFLLVVALVLAGVLAAPLVALAWYVRNTVARPLLTAPAALAGAVPAYAWTILFVAFSAQGPLPFRIWHNGTDPFSAPLGVLPAAIALAIPLVGFAVRHVALGRGEPPFALGATEPGSVAADGGSSDAHRGYALRSVAVECWTTLTYLVGAAVVVELVFAYPGLGYLWFQSLVQGDLPFLLGTTATVAFVLVALGVVRNLVTSVGEVLGATPSTLADSSALITDGGRSSDDGSTTRDDADATDPTTDARSDRAAANLPSLGSVLLSARTFQVGLVAFGLLFLVGTIGSLLTSFRPGYTPRQGLDLVVLVHATGSLTTTAVVATAVALPPGILAGTVAGRFGRPAGTILGYPKDVLWAFPLLTLGGLTLLFGGTGGGGRTTTELLIGVGTGLGILPGVFRATALEVDAVLADTPGARPGIAGTLSDALPAALAPALGRSVNYVGLAFLAAAEIGFLGLGPTATGVFNDVQAYVTVRPHLIPIAVVPVVVPALSLWLMADGLRASSAPE